MLDIGWSELVLIGVVALIVVGPKDLPIMFKTLGRFTAKARGMAREFQRAMDDAAKASGVGDALKDVKDMTSKKSLGLDALESAASKFEKWTPTLPGGKSAVVAAPAVTPAVTPVVTAAPAPAKPPLGPATQALADKLVADRAARLAPKTPSPAAISEAAAGPVAAKPVRKAVRRTPAAKAPEILTPPPSKAKAKPRAKKSDVE